jgi:hypothetical protein
VAPSLMQRFAWPLAAAAALLFMVGLALSGKRPDAGLAPFKAAGLLAAFAPEDAREVEVAAGGATWRFRRDDGWQAIAAPRPVPSDLTRRIDAALRLLRNAGPLRVLTPDEVGQVPASEYALGSDSLRVEVRSSAGASFQIQFGGRNPLGVARYVRVQGVDGLPMLPTYVAEAWEQVIGERQE